MRLASFGICVKKTDTSKMPRKEKSEKKSAIV